MATGEGHRLPDIALGIAPNDIGAAAGLAEEIQAGIEALATGGNAARQNLLTKARLLLQAVETPRETMARHCWEQPSSSGCILLGIEMGLWKLMASNGRRPQKVNDLAKDLSVDPKLLVRTMRHLGALGYITETGPNEYKPTNFSLCLSLPFMYGGYISLISCLSDSQIKFHEYSRQRGFVNPTDASDTAMMYAYNTDKDMFTYLQEIDRGQHFNYHMTGYRQGRPAWMMSGFYPVQERLVAGADARPDAPFLVDIGGNLGHDLQDFYRHHPNAPGRLILQDLPVVLSQITKLDYAITPMSYDFHTEQPVKGARAYFLHSILHDWPDDVCLSILSRVKEAMKPGYSRLLLNENVIPNQGAYWETTSLDMLMMTIFSSQERTQDHWRHLLEDLAGLKIVGIWSSEKGVESLIECERPVETKIKSRL
ncbi:S-adenosyl-L-methionine-dependent methyltransferase [Thozetella sp. PMI_491]|nr:S-adenosyl-L-methionine-dependent methyltransferase [Thozetella sp. PMI_491]